MKRLKIVVVLSVGIFFLGNINIVQSIGHDEKIYENIFIEEIDVSNLSKSEAKQKVEESISQNNKLCLVEDDKVFNLNLNDIGVVYNIDKSVEEAYNIGRDNGVIKNVKKRIDLKFGEKQVVNIEYSYDNKKIDDYISYIEQEVRTQPIDATVRVENNELQYTKETYGKNVDSNRLKEIIIYKIKDRDINENQIPVVYETPNKLFSQLSKIDTVLGTYETHFNPKCENRVNNIKVAARTTNDIILNQSSEFSFNNYVNNREIKAQFKSAPVIINGKLKEGIGGGICQVSSTIYNAALYSGLEITNVKNHSIPSAYISKGRDATVSTGNIDLKFKNNFNTPILIHNEVYEDRIISTIYGNKEDKKSIEIVTEITKQLPNKVKVKNSNKLYKGQREVFQKGRSGYKVNTFRIYKNEGNEVKEFIHESYYPPMDEIILYGTKEREIHHNIDGEVI